MLRRYMKYVFLGGATTTVGALGYELHRNDYEVGSLTVIRTGRAVIAAVDIARLYKRELYGPKLDRETEEYRELRSRVHQTAADRLLRLCRTNKGVFIKVGQHIGALDYLLPAEYVHTMRVLHKDAPSNTVDALYKVIREDLHVQPEQLFERFDPEPLGTASLAQVHKAKLRDGPEVAVKVQHYFVRKNVRTDLRTMEFLVGAMSRIFPEFQMQWLVEETKKNIFRELDFEQEGRNAEKLAQLFRHYSWLRIPKVFWEHTTKRVLMMEFVQGGQVNDLKYVKDHKIDPFDLSRKLGDLYSHMIFVHGFVHSDPHPGNILVNKDPKNGQLVVYLLDHGLYANLTEKFRYDYAQLWLGIIRRDRALIKKYAGNLGIEGNLYGLFACIVTGRPWEIIEKGIVSRKPGEEEKKLFQKHVPNLLNEISYCLQNMDRQTLLVLKSNDLIRSIEYALGTQERMCGFTVMTKCCISSVNREHLKNSKSLYDRTVVRMQNIYSILSYYLFVLYVEFKFRFLL